MTSENKWRWGYWVGLGSLSGNQYVFRKRDKAHGEASLVLSTADYGQKENYADVEKFNLLSAHGTGDSFAGNLSIYPQTKRIIGLAPEMIDVLRSIRLLKKDDGWWIHFIAPGVKKEAVLFAGLSGSTIVDQVLESWFANVKAILDKIRK